MKQHSLWQTTVKMNSRDSLSGHLHTQAAVIGGGLTGILCAYLLKEKGISPIILEAEETAHGVTAYTTGKITAQHGLVYDKMIRDMGEENARKYLYANLDATQKFKELIVKNNIDCNYEELPNIIYTLSDEEKIMREVQAANQLGLASEIIYNSPLPFPIKAGIRNYYSAQFNPLQFIQHLAKELTIYEHTKVLQIKGGTIITNNGTVTADHIIVASHYPIKDVPGFYFPRLTQSRSFLIAIQHKQKLDGMYLDEAQSGMTLRSYDNYLILGGFAQCTGCDSQASMDALEQKAKELYPNEPIEFLWAAQDCMSLDSIPYIGRYSMFTPNLYVATGYNKWGMTGSMVAAMLLSDQITHRDNPYASVFAPNRLNLKTSGAKLMHNFKTYAKSISKAVFGTAEPTLDDVKNGEGRIIQIGSKKRGVYKDESGSCHFIDPVCSHMGCQLKWNGGEKSWDCPCHGSRFDVDGNVINDPACHNIKK